MRAMVLTEFGKPLALRDLDIPEPGPGEIRVKVQACGVCGSDLFLQEGGFGTPLPIVPGHEAAGTVDAVGPGVDRLQRGDPVALYYISTPPEDPWAEAGRPNVSPHVERMGVDVDGAFAEYVVRPEASLVRPRDPVDPVVLAVLTDAVATPLHALTEVAQLQGGETLVVVGIGGLGSNAVQLGRLFGAEVIAVSRTRSNLDLAERLGAQHVVQSVADGSHVEQVRRICGGHGADVVVQCADSNEADEQAIAMGGPGGRVVLVGASTQPFRCRSVDLIWRELAVLGSRGFTPADIERAITYYADGQLDVSHLVEAVRPLEEANEALRDLADGAVVRSVLVP